MVCFFLLTVFPKTAYDSSVGLSSYAKATVDLTLVEKTGGTLP